MPLQNEQVGSEQNRDIERNISAQAVTVIKNNDNILPLKPQAGQKVLLLVHTTTKPRTRTWYETWDRRSHHQRKVDYETFRYTSANLDQVKQKIDDADYVIVISGSFHKLFQLADPHSRPLSQNTQKHIGARNPSL